MLRNPNKKSKHGIVRKTPNFRSVKFPGISNDAEALGTDRVTLYFALTGKRTSKKYRILLKRYQQLKGENN